MRLLKLTIKNFRGFGPNVEAIDLDADLVLFYGPNGHGKTSLSEAIEWLFYGTTKRRERGDGYSKSEYTGSFANAHGGSPTEVSLLLRFGGKDVTLTRHLGDKENSVTYVDGKEADFSTIGILPLEAYYPVVAQHGLQTFIHARPKDRRDAICAALGLDELTSLKAALERARLSFQKTPPTAVTAARNKLGGFVAELSQIGPTASVAARWSGNPATVDVAADEKGLLAAAAQLSGKPAPDAQTALKVLRDERAKAGQEVFDLSLLAPPEPFEERKAAAMQKRDELVASLRSLDDRLGKFAGAAAARYSAALLSFWQQGLALPASGDDCPMCEAPTLSEEQRSKLRERLANEKSTVEAITAIDEAASAASGTVSSFAAAIAGLGIKGTDDPGKARLLAMFGDQGALPEFIRHHDALLEARTRLGNALRKVRETGNTTKDRAANPEQLEQLISDRQSARDELIAASDAMNESLSHYEEAWAEISGELNAKIAANKAVSAIDAVGQAIQSMQEVRLLARYAEILDETQLLIRSVEGAAQTKQQKLLKSRGMEVKEYYELLNPGVAVGFDEMEPATDAMKLHATSFGKRMSAAANLSECQLNCLGLAMWLMRATTTSSPFGFVLLDDPVQAMDDDHAEAFIANIVPHLLDKTKKQVIVMSHVKHVVDRLRALNMDRDIRHYHYESFLVGGPVIVRQQRLNQALAEIKGAARGNEGNRAWAVDRLRVLIEGVVRELYLKKTGTEVPAKYDTATSGDLAEVFRKIPGTDPKEHAGMKDTIKFSDPAHHTQVGYAVPLQANIQPHVDRVEGIMKKYGLIS
jgi:hypothetical protein